MYISTGIIHNKKIKFKKSRQVVLHYEATVRKAMNVNKRMNLRRIMKILVCRYG